MKNKKINWLKTGIYSVLFAAFVMAMAMNISGRSKSAVRNENNSPVIAETTPVDPEKQKAEESKAAFMDAYRVFMHPRCMNCHPAGDIPLQGDDSHLHAQGVKRGKDGKGVYAGKCSNCHQPQHVPGDHMPPGAENWHLPPADKKMVFEGKSPRELAMSFKDNKFIDFAKDMVHHVEHEPLVLASWTYGTRPPLTHAEFVAKVKEWIAKGAVIP